MAEEMRPKVRVDPAERDAELLRLLAEDERFDVELARLRVGD
jgi:ERCC4-type nuclease